MSRGIDYGRGMTNCNLVTGIRYGVICQNEVLQAWADSSELVYPELEREQCETCGGEGEVNDCECTDCDGSGTIEAEYGDYVESIGAKCTDSEYDAFCGDCGDIFITRSPYFTRAAFCSPCAPGACYLMSPCEDGERAYCFGHDYFESGRAPYPVFSVETGQEVLPE